MNPTQQYRFNECTVTSYADAKALFSKARNPAKGKPLKGWCTMHRLDDEVYEVRIGNSPFVQIKPDNTLVFVCSNATARGYSITLSQALQRALPFYWLRVATGRYRVEHIKQMKYNESQSSEHWWEDNQHLRTKAPEFFEGIAFNLETGECINRKADILSQANAEVRKKWLSDLRKFKAQVKVRARVGAFDGLAQQVHEQRMARRNEWTMPDWTSDEWQTKLVDGIKEGRVSMELMTGLVQTYRPAYWSPTKATGDDVVKVVENLCKEYSIFLRRKYGVFDESTTEQPSA
jgi:hypothetical protein